MTLRDTPERLAVLERHTTRAMRDHYAQAEHHGARAQQASAARTHTTDTGTAITYESAAVLRDTMNAYEQERQHYAAGHRCAIARGRVLERAHQHRCLSAVRERISHAQDSTYAGVVWCVRSEQHDALTVLRNAAITRDRRQWQPPAITSRPLATCAASNAPGVVSPICASARDLRRICAASINTENDTT